MAAPIIERLQFLLTGDAQSLNKALKEAKKEGQATAQGLVAQFALAQVETDGLAKSLGGTLKAAARSVVSDLFRVTKEAITQADQTLKLSQAIGVSVEQYSTLSFAVRQSSNDADLLEKSLTGLLKRIREGDSATSVAGQAFASLGVETRTATGEFRATDAVLLDVADRFATMKDGSEKASLALAVFGKRGRELVPFLNLGRKGIEELQQKARELGIEISTDFAEQANQFQDQLEQLQEASVGVGRTIAQATVPELNKLAKTFLDTARSGDVFLAGSTAILTALEDLAAFGGVNIKLTAPETNTALDRLTIARQELGDAEKTLEFAQRQAAQFIGEDEKKFYADRLAAAQQSVDGRKKVIQELEQVEAEEAEKNKKNQQLAAAATQNRAFALEGLKVAEAELARIAGESAATQAKLDQERAAALEALQQVKPGDDAGRAAALENLRRAEAAIADEQAKNEERRQAALVTRGVVIADLTKAEKELEAASGGQFKAPGRETLNVKGESEQDANRRLELESKATQALESQLVKTQELTNAEQVRRSIATGAFHDFSAEAQTRLQLLAEELDLQKRQADARAAEKEETGKIADLQNQLEVERLLTRELDAQGTTGQALVQGERLRLQAAQEFAGFTDSERAKKAADLQVEIDQEKARRDEKEKATEAASQARDEQARQVDDVLESVKTLQQKEQEEIDTIQRLATVNEQVRAVQSDAIDKVREKYAELRERGGDDLITMAKIGEESAKTLQKGFVDLLIDPVNNGFDDILAKWLQTLQKMAAEGLVQEIFGGIGGKGGKGGGGLGGLLGGLFGAAEGGLVEGPGTSTSDSIPARLSDGEFVLRAAAVRRVGVGYLNSLNLGNLPSFPAMHVPTISVPHIPRFATGGLVEVPAETAQVNVPLRVVNLLDPKNITDEMGGSEGERVILNHIRSNASAIKTLLGGG